MIVLDTNVVSEPLKTRPATLLSGLGADLLLTADRHYRKTDSLQRLPVCASSRSKPATRSAMTGNRIEEDAYCQGSIRRTPKYSKWFTLRVATAKPRAAAQAAI